MKQNESCIYGITGMKMQCVTDGSKRFIYALWVGKICKIFVENCISRSTNRMTSIYAHDTVQCRLVLGRQKLVTEGEVQSKMTNKGSADDSLVLGIS